MFVRFYPTKYIHANNSFLYHLIDSDFTEEDTIIMNDPFHCVRIAASIINTYEKRNLNVARNLLLGLKYYASINRAENLLFAIDMCKKHLPQYQKYEEDVEK